jgi:hypothetical protein
MEDPAKAADNVDKLIRISQLFVDHVCNSVHECPMYATTPCPFVVGSVAHLLFGAVVAAVEFAVCSSS